MVMVTLLNQQGRALNGRKMAHFISPIRASMPDVVSQEFLCTQRICAFCNSISVKRLGFGIFSPSERVEPLRPYKNMPILRSMIKESKYVE